MAMGRLNRPALMVYGGTIRAGHTRRTRSSTSSPPSSATANIIAGKIDRREARRRSSATACPGAGACGGMYTANTMASAIEAMGMSLPYSSSIPAEDPAQARRMPSRRRGDSQSARTGPQAARHHDPRRRSKTRWSSSMALGGSTNAVLHLIAMARAVDVPLTIDDFQKVSDRVPFLADLKPSGKYVHGRPARRRRHAGRDEVSARERAARRRLPDRHRQDARREPRSDLPGLQSRPGRSCTRSRTRSRRPATSGSCAATSRPKAPWPRSPARKA